MAGETRTFFYRYAPTATGTSYVFGKCDPMSPQLRSAIATSGSSATTTDPNSTSGFYPTKVGDIIFANIAGVRTAKRIAAKASNNSITVEGPGADADAWNVGTGNTAWWVMPFTSGTAVTSGWVDVSRYGPNKTIHVLVNDLTGVTGGFNVIIQGKGYGDTFAGATPVWLYGPVNYATVNANTVTDQRSFVIGEDIASVRVGVTAGSVAGVNSEITIILVADVRAR